MDKIYPRLKIAKNTCHCGAINCLKLDGLPWRVYHIQYEGQPYPHMLFESRTFESARSYSSTKVDNSLSRRLAVPKYCITNGLDPVGLVT